MHTVRILLCFLVIGYRLILLTFSGGCFIGNGTIVPLPVKQLWRIQELVIRSQQQKAQWAMCILSDILWLSHIALCKLIYAPDLMEWTLLFWYTMQNTPGHICAVEFNLFLFKVSENKHLNIVYFLYFHIIILDLSSSWILKHYIKMLYFVHLMHEFNCSDFFN